MSQIYLTTTSETVPIEDRPGTLCIYHKATAPPVSLNRQIRFEEFAQNPRKLLAGVERLVVVGTNALITPANRTALVFEVLYNNTPDLQKISIDRTLFTSEPWRAWFHFGLTGLSYQEYTYSYLAESHYNAYIERARDNNPFSFNEICKWGEGHIVCLNPFIFDKISVETVHLSSSIHQAYLALKERCFEEERSIKGILRQLGSFAAEHCPQRRIPTKSAFFRKSIHHIIRTDLKVDEYLTEELLSLAQLTNNIARHFNDGSLQNGRRADCGPQTHQLCFSTFSSNCSERVEWKR